MIQIIRLTNLCCNLIYKGLLKNRLEAAKLNSEKNFKILLQIYNEGLIIFDNTFDSKTTNKLKELNLIELEEIDSSKTEILRTEFLKNYQLSPISNLEAVNFELTYECNSNCPHCILKKARNSYKNNFLNFDTVKRIIADAYFSGIIKEGINFTGGEALLAKVNIFKLISYASSLGVPTRLFTNAFWGNKYLFKAGDDFFTTPLSLVKALKKSGLTHLSLSFDSRIDKNKTGVKQLTAIINSCETLGLKYEIISSVNSRKQMESFIEYLKIALSVSEFKYMTPISLDLVDMGGANNLYKNHSIVKDLYSLINESYCKCKGYFRPNMLTIAPDGGVRSCMYGVGLSNLGNINETSLYKVLNNFNDIVTTEFRNKNIQHYVNMLYEPHKHIYNDISHPCTACVLIARLIQEYYSTGSKTNEEILKINLKVGRELNLLKKDTLFPI